MIIHFVCTGNIYRSRLAEAYCKSKGVAVKATCARADVGKEGPKLTEGVS